MKCCLIKNHIFSDSVGFGKYCVSEFLSELHKVEDERKQQYKFQASSV